jgi:hypothetical protein
MASTNKVVAFLAKAIMEQVGAPDRTNDLAALVTEFRSAPAGEPQHPNPDMELIKTVGEVITQEEVRARAEITLCEALPDLREKLEDKNQAPEKVAEELLGLVNKKQGVYILWCDIPGGPCYCHFLWSWNDNKRQTAFRIRDYSRGKLFVGVTAYTEGGKWSVERAREGSALQVWHAAKRRVRCRGALDFGIEETDKWKKTLEEMTRSLDPRTR